MGSNHRPPGLPAPLSDIVGHAINYAYVSTDSGIHKVWFRSEDVDFILWGDKCCCDTATIDYVSSPIEAVHGKMITIEQYPGGLYKISNPDSDIEIKWMSRHLNWVDEGGVKFHKRLREK